MISKVCEGLNNTTCRTGRKTDLNFIHDTNLDFWLLTIQELGTKTKEDLRIFSQYISISNVLIKLKFFILYAVGNK